MGVGVLLERYVMWSLKYLPRKVTKDLGMTGTRQTQSAISAGLEMPWAGGQKNKRYVHVFRI